MNAICPLSPPAYAEFAIQSNFSFLRGASHPEELAVTAARQGLKAMGLADCNTVAGTVRAWSQAKQAGLAYHPGCRLVFCDGTPDILAYPRDRAGWGHLCRLLTQANMREESEKGNPLVFLDDLLQWGAQMSLAVIFDPAMAPERMLTLLKQLKSRFANAVRLAVSPAYAGNDSFHLQQATALAGATGIALMAVGNVLYHTADRRVLQDVLTAIRLKKTVSHAAMALHAHGERYLKPPGEMARLFCNHPGALAETIRFAGELSFSLSDLEYNYPDEPTESGLEPQAELERLTWQGAGERFPDGLSSKVEKIIRHELETVRKLNYARYFLTVHDIVTFARSKNILCQGRGSAANSIICFCLRITDVGPDVIDTLFERFISAERDEPPDIDVDFEHEKREIVIEYIYNKYSAKRTALAASVVTYRSRSAMREVAKAMGLSEDVQSALSSSIWGSTSSQLGESQARAGGLDQEDPTSRHVMALANEIMGFPRHLSQHVGGFVITRDRLDEMVPIVKTAMDERKMVEWDKDDLDAVKMLKVDVLALGMLSCLRRSLDLLESHYGIRDKYGRPLQLATIPAEDQRVYDMICRADTLGVFQIESRAQMSMLPRLKPREFYDLVIEVAIVRPGPIQGDMVHPYLRRRQGLEKAEYVKPELEAVLQKTLGVPLFQEQAMRIAIEAGGFSPGEADQLRRAMATFRRMGTIGNYKRRMIEGMVEKDYPREFAERCFKQIEGFGEYGFPESHAASFALLVYASCWLKCFYPDIFCAAILNSQPMGFYAPAQLIRDAKEHGVVIRAADINWSDWDCTLEPDEFDTGKIQNRHAEMRSVIKSNHAVRLGLRQIKGLAEDDVTRLVEMRGKGYSTVYDLWLRSGLSMKAMKRLANADVFRSIGLDRRAALWEVRGLDRKSAAERLPLFEKAQSSLRDHEPKVELPSMPLGEHVIHDYRHLGLSLKAHPVAFLRPRLYATGIAPNAILPEFPDGKWVMVAGLVLVRQRPGKGNAIFLTLEDEGGIANVIIWPRTFKKYRPLILGSRFICVRGKLQSESGVIHIVANHIEDLTSWLADLSETTPVAPNPAEKGKVQGSVSDMGRKITPRAHLMRLMRTQPDLKPDTEKLVKATGKVMPKGRNFH